MPKFYGQNKKRIDPRYFLDETKDRDFKEQWEPDDSAEEEYDEFKAPKATSEIEALNNKIHEAIDAAYNIESEMWNITAELGAGDIASSFEQLAAALSSAGINLKEIAGFLARRYGSRV